VNAISPGIEAIKLITRNFTPSDNKLLLIELKNNVVKKFNIQKSKKNPLLDASSDFIEKSTVYFLEDFKRIDLVRTNIYLECAITYK